MKTAGIKVTDRTVRTELCKNDLKARIPRKKFINENNFVSKNMSLHISSESKRLHIVEGTLNAKKYQGILEPHLSDYFRRVITLCEL